MNVSLRAVTCLAVFLSVLPSCSSGPSSPTDGGLAAADAGPGQVLPPTPEVQALLEAAAKVKSGGLVDMDGDGREEFERTVEDGTATYWTVNASGDTIFQMQINPDGTGGIASDDDADGNVEVTREWTKSPLAQVISRDTDLDGRLETRTTETFDTAAGTVHIVVEKDPDGTGFTTTLDVTEPISREAGGGTGGCNGADGFPEGDGPSIQIGSSGMVIKTSGKGSDVDGRCSEAHGNRLAKAVQCALDKGAKCMAQTNSRLGSEFNAALAEGLDVDFACGNGCTPANTMMFCLPGTSFCWGKPKINVSPGTLDDSNVSDGDLCNIMLHELLHALGEGFEAEHNNGFDEIYSCGRYCGTCSKWGMGSPDSSNIDCLRCATSMAKKVQCGVRQKLEQGSCGDSGVGICHKGLACISGSCESCSSIVTRLCDNATVTSSFHCCAACPSNCNGSNDFPCSGTPNLDDTCNSPPPACK
ncbi:MAG: hypothetical protein QM765_45695 [Myxococcales bacterium]